MLSHSNPKRQARIANAVVDGLPKAGGVHDIRPDHTPVIRVASLNAGEPPPALRRKDGQRVVTVAADVTPAVIFGDEAKGMLANLILADLTAVHSNLTYTFGGKRREQLDPLDALYRGFAIVLIMIFTRGSFGVRTASRIQTQGGHG